MDDVNKAWVQLIQDHMDTADPYDVYPVALTDWTHEDLIAARTYIGRVLSARELARSEAKEVHSEKSPA